jgi:hypothetical protein
MIAKLQLDSITRCILLMKYEYSNSELKRHYQISLILQDLFANEIVLYMKMLLLKRMDSLENEDISHLS